MNRKMELFNNDEARLAKRNELVEANLGLASYVAKKYIGLGGLEYEDLVSEGYFGLLAAAERFDPTRGYKFSTYACIWIRQAILKAIANNSRLSTRAQEELRMIIRARDELRSRFCREVSVEEIAKATSMSVDKAALLLEVSQEVYSLSLPIGDDDGRCLLDVLECTTIDQSASDIEDAVELGLLHDFLFDLMEVLDSRQRQVLLWRYGFVDKCLSLEEVSLKLGVSRERFHQIEKQALERMRAYYVSEYFLATA